jgi:hypothetical protein
MPTTSPPRILSARVTHIAVDWLDTSTMEQASEIRGPVIVRGVATLADRSRMDLVIYLTDEEHSELAAVLAKIEARFRG